ncbi:FAD binding domain-containing protein [Phyllosticta citriasiana]|uniref:FAD binding domain-containing protein n=1 Tax=Phyllosticta citriasiana TaxID=595635 RepID=UPI0030FD510F
MEQTHFTPNSTVHDVIIVGAGPCGLAVAARLCEHTPSAIFTDEEHQRYHWIKKHGARMSIKDRKNGKVKMATPRLGRQYSTLVLDATGDQWMSRWNRLFKTYDISHLRSPMFFHVDPGDRDGLLAYAHEQGREGELDEIRDCVGKEISKHQRKKRAKGRLQKPQAEVVIDERDRKDYYRPSRPLFTSHCECIVERYGLRKGLVQQKRVEDIQYGIVREYSDIDKIFTVKTNKGVHFARTVVLAVGPGNSPKIPGPMPLGVEGQETPPQMCHSMQIQQFPDPVVMAKIKAKQESNILVVGGGLTSAQLADLAIRKGVSKVYHLMRGPVKVKHFDFDLAWTGKFRNFEQAIFWTADSDEDRLAMIRQARNGGSINPPYHKRLLHHAATRRLALHTHTTISSLSYDARSRSYSVSTNPPTPTPLPPIDYIYYATGIETDYATLPFLRSINAAFPVDGFGGMPCITDDLMWRRDVPLFVTGRMAGLRLGPAAGNLGGARQGAERVAWAVEELLDKTAAQGFGSAEESDEQHDGEQEALDFVAGRGSRYGVLGSGDGDEDDGDEDGDVA